MLHVSAIMGFGLKGSASWVTVVLSFLNFQVLFSLVCTEDHPLNILSGLLCQAAAKGVLWKSCKLMFTQNTRPKRCKMSPGQKS